MKDRISIEGAIVRMAPRMGAQHALPVSTSALKALDLKSGDRIIVQVKGDTHRRAIHRDAQTDEYFIMLGAPIRSRYGWKEDSVVTVEIWRDPNPDAIDMPEELEVALAQMPDAQKAWDALTPGRQRSYCYYVDSAKRAETRANRAVDFCRKLIEGRLHKP